MSAYEWALMRKAISRSRTEGRDPDSLGVAEKALLGVAVILLLVISGWHVWTGAAAFWGAFANPPAPDPATLDALAESEPAPLWKQLLMAVAVFGLIAAPVVILWVVARGGQALYRDLAALRTARGKE